MNSGGCFFAPGGRIQASFWRLIAVVLAFFPPKVFSVPIIFYYGTAAI